MDLPPKSSSPEDWFNRCRELCEPLSKDGCKFCFSLQQQQQVGQPDLLKKTPLKSDSDGEKPDELTGPTTKTDLSGDVKEAAGREVTSPDPLGLPLPKYCGTCENRWPRAIGGQLNSD